MILEAPRKAVLPEIRKGRGDKLLFDFALLKTTATNSLQLFLEGLVIGF
jgi:hypothetical protein